MAEDNEIYRRLGVRLRRERERLGWTQEELGERSGFHASYIGQIERCRKKVSLAAVERLAAALGATLGQLLDRKGSTRPTTWESRLEGLLRDKSADEQAALYGALKGLAAGIGRYRRSAGRRKNAAPKRL